MKSQFLRIALCQIDPTVGDLSGNASKIERFIGKSKELGADIAVFPELALTGYPPEDLLLKPKFVSDNISFMNAIAKKCDGISAVVGFVNENRGKLYNSAAVINDKNIVACYDKICLPNYGVFDEKRYFTQGESIPVFNINGLSFGISICEDLWDEKSPAKELVKKGVDLLIIINASPYYVEKWGERAKKVKECIKHKRTVAAYLNLAGGQDDLVFDGHSFVMNGAGKMIARGAQFREDFIIFDIETPSSKKAAAAKEIVLKSAKQKIRPQITVSNNAPLPKTAEIYEALRLGLKDYVLKNDFKKVVLGLSGGIDSALTAAIAVDAIGKENVVALFMPSQYSSARSENDAEKLAKNLGIELVNISIKDIFASFLKELKPHFKDIASNTAEENLQARIRGNLLMAFSNKFGHLVLATGNKSEASTGYATLYGDMAGGLSVIKDVPKTLVYELSKYRNKISNIIPKSIIKRAPTAELKPNQKDRDTLPPYAVLDKIIHEYVENDKSAEEIVKTGVKKEIVSKTIRMIDNNEYKRRQSAPGIKITPKAFGKDRRLPITNRYSGS